MKITKDENNEILNNTPVLSGNTYSDFPSLLPFAMNVAVCTIGMGSSSLDEDSYTNEKRKRILDDIFDEKETDYDKLDDLKKDYMVYNNDGLVSVQPTDSPKCEMVYLDYKYNGEDFRYEPLKNNDIEQ